MSSVVPPPAPLPVTGTAAGGPVALTPTGGQMAALPVGTMLEAVAQARAAKGVMTVTTPDGTVQLKALPGQTLPPIPEGARLLLQVTDQGVTLLAVNGRPLAGMSLPGAAGTLAGAPFGPGQTGLPPFMGATTAQTAAGQPGLPGQAGTPLAAAPTGLPGQTLPGAAPGLTATMIRPASAQDALQGAAMPTADPAAFDGGLPPDLPAGTRLTVRIAGIDLPGQPAGQAAGQSATAPPATSPRPGTVPAGPDTPAAAQPQPPTVAPPPAGAPRLLTATVVAHPPGGQAVVQTTAGTLALPTQSDLPVGTRLQLELSGRPELPPPAAAGAGPAPSTGLKPGGWPTLAETMSTLSAAGDRQALDMLMRTLPQIGPRLAANIALFAGAMRAGDVRAVLSDGTTKGLEKAGRKDLAERLKGELEQMAKDGGRPVAGGEWAGFTLPLLFGQVIDPVQLYVRRPKGDDLDDPAKGGGGERFLLDFNLSRLGRMQMDGLVRRDDKLFDLIIRTDQPLPTEMRHDILGIFTNASELVGTKGTVAFQSGGRWVELAPDAPPPTKIIA